MKAKPLWICPNCQRPFANAHQWHSCGRYKVQDHLQGKSPATVALYRRFVALVKKCGPVRIMPTKTRIGFQVRMIFAAVMVKKDWLDAHVILARRLDHPRFTKIESFSPRNHLHQFRIQHLEELDDEVVAWLQEAYAVGEQKHWER